MQTESRPWLRPHEDDCHCVNCTYIRRREAEANRQPRILVAADESREHVLELVARGVHKSEIARRAGVSPALVSKVLKPGSWVNESTAEKLLAVEAA